MPCSIGVQSLFMQKYATYVILRAIHVTFIDFRGENCYNANIK